MSDDIFSGRRSRSEFVDLPGRRYHLRHWGDESAPLLLMLHGWMDTSGTFQFLVDALQQDWHVVSPDWMGYGLSQWHHRPYWLAELILDLDALADQLSPTEPLRIVGHSMGGNIASLWAGSRPQRLERLVMVEAFGHPKMTEEAAAGLYGRWLDDGRDGPRETTYDNLQAFEERLRKANKRLSAGQAARISGWLARELDDGRIGVRVDPWQRNVLNHLVHQDAEFFAAWRRVTSPVLWITAADSDALHRMTAIHGGEAKFAERLAHFPSLQRVHMQDAGHNIQHDQPEALAAVIEKFMCQT
jgi:pimeloyl-ACP methyl ester carboxylesterase